jgi:predicted Zn-ribbon and HTH transcriptional regulator
MAKKVEGTDNAVCPQCGYEDKQSWEYNLNGESTESECPECSAEFTVWRHVYVTYSTELIEKTKQPTS